MKKYLSLFSVLLFFVLPLNATINWSPSFPITNEPIGTNASSPQISVTPGGDAAAVWYNSLSGFRTVQGATKSANGNWTNYNIFSTYNVSAGPNIALNATGDGVVIWTERYNGVGNQVVRVARLLNGIWSSPGQIVQLSDQANRAQEVSIAIDATGNAVAVWVEFDNTLNAQIVKTKSMINGVWDILPTSLSDSSQNSSNPHVGMGASGNAVAVWLRPDGVKSVIQSKSLISGIWDVTATDLSDSTEDADAPQVAVTNNKAVAIWRRATDGTDTIYVVQAKAKTMPSGAWDLTATDLSDSSSGYPDNPQVSLDANSNGVAVWQWATANGLNNRIQARQYISGSWGVAPAVTISDIAHDNIIPQVAATSLSGDAVAIWLQLIDDFNNVVQSTSLPFNGNWNPVQDLSPNPPNGLTPDHPQVALAANGIPSAVWSQDGSPYNIWYDTVGLPLQPPSFLSGKQKNDNFGALSELFNQINWNASTSSAVVGYAIYRNGTLIATVGPNIFKYKDHNRIKGQSTTYGVAAINSSGSQSSQITTTIH